MPAQPGPVAPPSLDRRAVNTALVLILIGGPIVVLDLTVSEGGSRPVDVVNDTIGLGLILLAVSQLVRQPGPASYVSRMRAVVVLSVLMLLWSIVVQVASTPPPNPIRILMSGLSVLGTILFCSAMRLFSVAHGFHASAESWRKALIAVAVVLGGGWIVGVLLSLATNPVMSATTGSVYALQHSVDVGSAAILFFLVALALLLIPLVFILIAIGTTRRELRAF
jgi:hypothetical protein